MIKFAHHRFADRRLLSCLPLYFPSSLSTYRTRKPLMLVKTPLKQSTPEAQGIASATILAFLDAIDAAEIELNSLILVRHGQQVARGWWTPYAAEVPHMLFSLSKSFTSTAVGMAV